jgi:hypothetical protein
MPPLGRLQEKPAVRRDVVRFVVSGAVMSTVRVISTVRS